MKLIEASTMSKANRLFNAFCTIHYFVTGNNKPVTSKHSFTATLAYWFAYLDKSLCTDDYLDSSYYAGC